MLANNAPLECQLCVKSRLSHFANIKVSLGCIADIKRQKPDIRIQRRLWHHIMSTADAAGVAEMPLTTSGDSPAVRAMCSTDAVIQPDQTGRKAPWPENSERGTRASPCPPWGVCRIAWPGQHQVALAPERRPTRLRESPVQRRTAFRGNLSAWRPICASRPN